ncbi:MAG: transglycosylase domain-containing protein [Prevotella sp.]|nr:transglycosylase domain-containing protein [Bacteroidales bacterium]MDY4230267.1 transglycosylase domain-containing protein [Prevotella sp.]
MKKIIRFLKWSWKKIKGFWPWYKNLYFGKAWYTKTLIGFVSFIVAFFLYLGAVDINFLWLFGKSPGYFSGILDPQTSQASEIYSADGVLIGKYFNENRTPVKYDEVNPDFFKALIDTEDERFYKHFGIDPIGLFAAAKDALLRHDGRGASTITQQLAKNMFRVRSQYSTGLLGHIPGVRILIIKSKEWIIATKLETVYSKKKILTMYANTVDFGSNAYGIKTGARTYFNTTPKDLTTEQCAVLVGMLKATSYYNPRTNPENSINRRNQVLNNMYTHKDLTKAECDSLKEIPLKLNLHIEENYDGIAQYFRNAVADYLKPWCDENGYDLYSDGLKIYTTLDSRMQKYAEEAAIKQMKQVQRNFENHWGPWNKRECWIDENGQVIPGFIENIAHRLPTYKMLQARYAGQPDSVEYYMNKPHKVKVFDYEKGFKEMELSTMDSIRYMVHFMHCAFIAMEPQSGAVKAWVGDVDFNTWKYDKVKAMRQPGSTFKLFVYTEAMNQGLTPCDKRRDEYISMQVYDKIQKKEVTWTPTNANGSFSGDSIPLKSAFAKSINSIAVRLGQEVGIRSIIETAQKMGIQSPLDDTPSLALGSSDVNLLELADAYSTIANDGKHHDPVLVTRIVDSKGKEVYVAPDDTEQAVPYKSAFLMQQMLMGGLREPGGTSQSLNGYVGDFRDCDWGGKTGTSNNHSDAWFMGVSPNLVVGAWVGGEYRSIHFRTGALGQGSRTALPICGYFLKSLLADPNFKQYRAKFKKPQDPDITNDMYECASYYQPVKHQETNDSTEVINEDIELDEDGNPIATPDNQKEAAPSTSTDTKKESAAEPKKKETPKRPKEVTMDDF